MLITECEFDNTDMEGTPSVEWRHVSDKQKQKET